jgi:hypothetical protein
MMARASRSIPTYTPSIYLPGSFGRYRQYPRVVRTPIPGAGVKAGRMIWGEQVMNLWGDPVAKYSNNNVPLLGLGDAMDVMRSVRDTLVPNWRAAAFWFSVGFLAGRELKGRHWRGLSMNRRRRR